MHVIQLSILKFRICEELIRSASPSPDFMAGLAIQGVSPNHQEYV